MQPLHRPRLAAAGGAVTKVSVVLRELPAARPPHPHDSVVRSPPPPRPPRPRHAERNKLFLKPPDANTEIATPAGETVQAGDFLRGVHRVPQRHQANAYPQADTGRHGRRKNERRKRIDEPGPRS